MQNKDETLHPFFNLGVLSYLPYSKSFRLQTWWETNDDDNVLSLGIGVTAFLYQMPNGKTDQLTIASGHLARTKVQGSTLIVRVVAWRRTTWDIWRMAHAWVLLCIAVLTKFYCWLVMSRNIRITDSPWHARQHYCQKQFSSTLIFSLFTTDKVAQCDRIIKVRSCKYTQ